MARLAFVCFWLLASASISDAETLSKPGRERAIMRKAEATPQSSKEDSSFTDREQEGSEDDAHADVKSELEEDDKAGHGKVEEDESAVEEHGTDEGDESTLEESGDDTESAEAQDLQEAEKDLKEGDEGGAPEVEDIHYVAEKSLNKLKKMSGHGHASEDAILALISDKFEQTLSDNEMMVPVRIEGFTGHFPDALKKMAPSEFLEKVMNGLNVPAEHKPMTLAELAADTEHEAKAGDDGDQGEEQDDGKDSDVGESLLEDDGKETDVGDDEEAEESDEDKDPQAEGKKEAAVDEKDTPSTK